MTKTILFHSEDDDESDGISIISESDRDESRDLTNSQYFWDNTHISLHSLEQEVTEDVQDDQVTEEREVTEAVTDEVTERDLQKDPVKAKTKKFWKLILLINLILISNIATYNFMESMHSTTIEKYESVETQNKILRNEVNTLRRIIFLMNVEEQAVTTTSKPIQPFDTPNQHSEDVRIFDNNRKKFICVDVKRFVDML